MIGVVADLIGPDYNGPSSKQRGASLLLPVYLRKFHVNTLSFTCAMSTHSCYYQRVSESERKVVALGW